MKELLKLSRSAIESHFKKIPVVISENVKKNFSEKRACFVTLTKNNQLRGCIGDLQPREELYKNVVDNSINAAFWDPRFSPLEEDELDEIKIEISVLDIPKKLEFKNADDLLKKLDKKHGVILKKGFNSATYLPQVWDEISDKKEFLSSLCVKAGLYPDFWENHEFEIFVYEVEKIKE